ncbi:MAG: hypothetical protein ACI4ED_00295 [Suilimivivens sp.]
MKLKYYLRGLGTGIIVTAVIMGVTLGSRKETLSDREIMERAAELGMVQQGSSLADMENAAEAAQSPEPVKETSPEPVKSPEPTETPAPSEKPEPAKTDEKKEASSEVDGTTVIKIEIKAGEGSYTICQKLEKEGLITSASDFDTYLYSNGYDRKLRTGSYEIPADADPEEIAAILTCTQ